MRTSIFRMGSARCTFQRGANQAPAESQASAQASLYAIVNSICDTCNDIQGVRIVIDNGAVNTFRGEISWTRPSP